MVRRTHEEVTINLSELACKLCLKCTSELMTEFKIELWTLGKCEVTTSLIPPVGPW